MRNTSTWAVLALLGLNAGCSSESPRSSSYLVKDIRPGPEDGLPRDDGKSFGLHALGDTLLLRASDGAGGPALWRSDGTEAGTQLAWDLVPDSSDPFREEPVVLGNALYFFAGAAGAHGLWKLEQGAAAPVLVKTLPLREKYSTYGLQVFGSHLSFRHETGELGIEPWVSDGSAEGTRPLKDILPGSGSSDPISFCAPAGPYYYFMATDGTQNRGLWRSDGTEAGTSLVQQLKPPSTSVTWVPFTVGGRLYLRRSDFDRMSEAAGDLALHDQLWRSDGTEAGSRVLLDFPAGSGTSWWGDMAALGDTLILPAAGGSLGEQLWALRGEFDRTLLAEGAHGDGVEFGFRRLESLGERLVFIGRGTSRGDALWSTDGTPAGTRRLQDARFGDAFSKQYVVIDGLLLFSNQDEEHGRELWRSDGTPEGTFLVEDLRPGAEGSNPSHFTRVGDTLYFRANDGKTGYELWAIPWANVKAPAAASASAR